MRVRLIALLVAILFAPTLAYAEAHKADLFGGYSGGSGGSKVQGFAESIAWDVSFCRWCSVVGDTSVQFGSHKVEGVTPEKALTQVAYQGGFRASLMGLAASMRRKDRSTEEQDPQLKIFLQFLAGQVYTNDGTDADRNNGVVTLGGGFQYFFKKAMPEGGTVLHAAGVGVQAQVDYIWRNDRESFVRVSGGVAYRFLKAHKH